MRYVVGGLAILFLLATGISAAAHEETTRLLGTGAAYLSPERPLISFMLRHREELQLSDEQVKALEALRSDFQKEAVRRSAEIRVAELELQELLREDPVDLGKVEAKVRQIEALRAEHRLSRIKTIERGKALLTPEQRRKLESLVARRMGWQAVMPMIKEMIQQMREMIRQAYPQEPPGRGQTSL